MNPFILAEAEGPRLYGAEDDPGERRTPISRLSRCMGELHDAQKDLDYMEKELAQIKSHIHDKDTIINLYKDKVSRLDDQVAKLKAELEEYRPSKN